MERHFAVHFSVRKGLGPEWREKIIEVGFDDIEPHVQEWEIIDMAKAEAKAELHRIGYSEQSYIYKDIHST